MKLKGLDADEVTRRGWLRVPGFLDAAGSAGVTKPSWLEWRHLAPLVGKVQQNGWFAQLPFEQAGREVRALGAEVHAAFVDLAPHFNEVTWQLYEPGAGRIGAHRDQTHYTGVIAIVTLSGRAPFAILARRDPPELLEAWDTCPGDLVLLRGAGFGAPRARCPLHEVGAPEGIRTTITLRHNVRGAGGWDEGEAPAPRS